MKKNDIIIGETYAFGDHSPVKVRIIEATKREVRSSGYGYRETSGFIAEVIDSDSPPLYKSWAHGLPPGTPWNNLTHFFLESRGIASTWADYEKSEAERILEHKVTYEAWERFCTIRAEANRALIEAVASRLGPDWVASDSKYEIEKFRTGQYEFTPSAADVRALLGLDALPTEGTIRTQVRRELTS